MEHKIFETFEIYSKFTTFTSFIHVYLALLKSFDIVPPIEIKLPAAAMNDFDILLSQHDSSISRYNTVLSSVLDMGYYNTVLSLVQQLVSQSHKFMFTWTFIVGQSSSLATQKKVTSLQLSLFFPKTVTPVIVLVLPFELSF